MHCTYLFGNIQIIHSKIAPQHPSRTGKHTLILTSRIEARRVYYRSMGYLSSETTDHQLWPWAGIQCTLTGGVTPSMH